ncbi:MAG: xanthine dehydrogenase family protein subunit M [Dehalococcoidia bacterium]|nr:xanthine dehydrogenase family protein subunit M [Dehalococcoidia bacterium]MCA9845848.1 xanthine dehydrogenase family protein subunit M [Dehalococcoidia bacterium]
MEDFTNTHILVGEFELIEPHTLAQASESLRTHAGEAVIMAGGTDLLVGMKMEHIRTKYVISLGRISALKRVDTNSDLVIGATASIRDVAHNSVVRQQYCALAEACQSFSTMQIMVMGTVGGNLCNASPAADTAPALLALDASVHLTSGVREREIALSEFFTGPGGTVLSDGEVLEHISVPAPSLSTGSAFLKMGRVAADISKVSVAVTVVRSEDRVRQCRIALGAVASTPRRIVAAESELLGEKPTISGISKVSQLVQQAIEPITDVRSTAAYRRHLAGVLVGDAFRQAWLRAGGGEIT